MDPTSGLLDQLPGMGIGGILAGFLIWLLNKTWKDHIDTIKGFHDVEKGRTEMLVGIIKDNTNQTVRNTTVLDSLHRRLDKDAAEREEIHGSK
jgi:hypothetical protein